MITKLLYKWFGIEKDACESCAVLHDQLDRSERERADLLERLLNRVEPEIHTPVTAEELKPITPQYVPWRVKQQMLEAEDRKTAQLLAAKRREMQTVAEKGHEEEIEKLEKELGVQ